MNKKIITFEANEQSLIKTGGISNYSSNKVSYIEAEFELGENWQGFDAVRAIWYNKAQTISMVLADGKCIVPHEVLANKGQVMVNLVGSISENDVLTDRLTTYPVVALIVDADAKVDGSNTYPITPSQFEQFVEAVKEDADRAEQGASDAETYANNAETSADNALLYSQNAEGSAIRASSYALDAQGYAQNAETAKDEAEDARDEILGMSANATTLPAGSSATASYSDGVLSLGIPRGDTGATGAKGDTGATPNLTIGTVETLEPTESATATITGTDENPVLNLGLPKGEQGDVSQAQLDAVVSDLKSDLGEWSVLEKNNYTGQYPFVQIDSFVSRKIWVNIAECSWEHDDVTVRGSVDGWQTQETIEKFSQDTFIVTVPNTYSSIRIAINGKSSQTGTLKVVTHQVTDDAISDYVTQNVNDINSINEAINGINYNFESLTNGMDLAPFKDEELVATRFEGFYLNTNDKIGSIGNTAFVVKQYAVTQGVTYNISGRSRLNAALPIAAFGYIPCANGAVFEEVLLDGSTSYSDYDLNYTPEQDGYIFIAVHTNYTELSAYSTALNSEALKKVEDFMLQNIKIQLFGDSITDNQWGDLKTWANYVPNYFGSNAVIINDAVGGSGIGHGKSTTTPSHQDDPYNGVYDLVTDGTTLQTDADVVVILAGTNNWASGTPLGDMSSSGYSTIYGALKGIVEYISQHSKAIVFICTIPQRYNSVDQGRETNEYGEPINSQGNTLSEFCEPFRKVSAFYGMPCIHLNEALGWNRLNISQFTSDGLHPNADGDKMLASFICSEIKKHC